MGSSAFQITFNQPGKKEKIIWIIKIEESQGMQREHWLH